jgi:dihydrofolate reductase
MARIAAFLMVSVDGYYDGDQAWVLDWHNVDEEFNDFAIKQLDASDCLVFGRATYQGMAQYWPSPQAIESDPQVASRMNNAEKVVVSRHLEELKPEWTNTRLINRDVDSELSSLKQEKTRDILVLGSGELTKSLASSGLLDELRVMVNPVLLGSGKSLFLGGQRTALTLRDSRRFQSGNTLLTYDLVR